MRFLFTISVPVAANATLFQQNKQVWRTASILKRTARSVNAGATASVRLGEIDEGVAFGLCSGDPARPRFGALGGKAFTDQSLHACLSQLYRCFNGRCG